MTEQEKAFEEVWRTLTKDTGIPKNQARHIWDRAIAHAKSQAVDVEGMAKRIIEWFTKEFGLAWTGTKEDYGIVTRIIREHLKEDKP